MWFSQMFFLYWCWCMKSDICRFFLQRCSCVFLILCFTLQGPNKKVQHTHTHTHTSLPVISPCWLLLILYFVAPFIFNRTVAAPTAAGSDVICTLDSLLLNWLLCWTNAARIHTRLRLILSHSVIGCLFGWGRGFEKLLLLYFYCF